MGLPRIIYDPGGGAVNFDIPEDVDVQPDNRVPRLNTHVSRGGVRMRHFHRFDEIVAIEIKGIPPDTQLEEDAQALWSWIGPGGPFAFAYDRDDTIDTTMDNAEAAGATLIEVPDTTGMTPGNKVELIAASGGWQKERVTMGTVTASTSFVVTSPAGGIRFSYAAGDIVRSVRYWPALVVLDQEDQPMKVGAGGVLSFHLRCVDYAALVTP